MKKWCIKEKREKEDQHSDERHHFKIRVLGISQSKLASNHTYVPRPGIWGGEMAKTNIVKQNIHKTSCSPNQHAQILYNSHTKENICANERKYTEGLYSDTQTRKWQGTNRNQPKSKKRRARAMDQPLQTYQSIEYEIKIQNILRKTRKDTCHMALEPHRWPVFRGPSPSRCWVSAMDGVEVWAIFVGIPLQGPFGLL